MSSATSKWANERLLICKSCPDSEITFAFGMTCGKFLQPTDKTCGCKLTWKAKLKNSKCPQNKWPKLSGDDF